MGIGFLLRTSRTHPTTFQGRTTTVEHLFLPVFTLIRGLVVQPVDFGFPFNQPKGANSKEDKPNFRPCGLARRRVQKGARSTSGWSQSPRRFAVRIPDVSYHTQSLTSSEFPVSTQTSERILLALRALLRMVSPGDPKASSHREPVPKQRRQKGGGFFPPRSPPMLLLHGEADAWLSPSEATSNKHGAGARSRASRSNGLKRRKKRNIYIYIYVCIWSPPPPQGLPLPSSS